jgi:4'-phosphopantetheinyl transferase
LKESYIKARGLGFSLPLDRFGFRYSSSNRLELCIAPELNDAPSRWHICQLRPSADYVIALCISCGSLGRPAVRVRKCLPLGAAEIVTCPIERQTGTGV